MRTPAARPKVSITYDAGMLANRYTPMNTRLSRSICSAETPKYSRASRAIGAKLSHCTCTTADSAQNATSTSQRDEYSRGAGTLDLSAGAAIGRRSSSRGDRVGCGGLGRAQALGTLLGRDLRPTAVEHHLDLVGRAEGKGGRVVRMTP